MVYKICGNCGQFTQHKARGLCNRCYEREVNYPKHHKQRIAKVREYRDTHHNEICMQKREYYKTNHDKILTRKRRSYEINRGNVLARIHDRYHNGNSDTIFMVNKGKKSYWRYGNGKEVHRIIAEETLGRKLKSYEVVHHIDGNGLNNVNNNLLICTRSYHTWMHGVGRFE